LALRFSFSPICQVQGDCGGRCGHGEGVVKDKGVPYVVAANAELEPSQIQDLGDVMPKLLEVKAKSNTPIRFHIRIELETSEHARQKTRCARLTKY